MKKIKKKIVPYLVSLIILGGCAALNSPIINSNGQPIKFAEPVLGKAAMENATYVLIEKSVADGTIHLVNISKTRQPIENERQERIAFNGDLTRFAPDFGVYAFQTYSDTANYDQQTVVMRCTGNYSPRKTVEYSPCSSAFGRVFVPMGVYKAGAVNNSAAAEVTNWENPNVNRLRFIASPEYALRQAGVFDHLDQLVNAK
jgi:hypothetical protein